MIEKVNPAHPDKVADRIAGAIVDMAYAIEKDPRIAVEVLLGHGDCYVIIETNVHLDQYEIEQAIKRIAGDVYSDINIVQQDRHLAENQAAGFRCGDNGIFRGVPLTEEQKKLSRIAREIYEKYPSDGKYILDGDRLIICQSNAPKEELEEMYPGAEINPLGDWTGGTDVDTGATNRKIGSDLADSITGGGLCVSGETEYLGDDLRWHRMDEYVSGKVAQWNNGQLEFVYPLKYIKNERDDFILFENNSKLSMKLTPNHEVLLLTSKQNLNKKRAGDVAEKLLSGKGNGGFIPHWFRYSRRTESEYESENALRLQIAFCADGTILHNKTGWTGRFNIKRERKKERLRQLLSGMPYTESKGKDGYSQFWVKVPKVNKSLYECCKNEDLGIVADEIFQWDGDSTRRTFRTTRKEDADFAQLAIAASGKCASILVNNRTGEKQVVKGKEYIRKSICYTVTELASEKTILRNSGKEKIHVSYCDPEPSYCFTVPSHNLVLRHNNRIFITGNCGKDLSKADVSVTIHAFLKAQRTGKPVELSCAIGDTEVDGMPYSTIVEEARIYILSIGGFEKLAEWGMF